MQIEIATGKVVVILKLQWRFVVVEVESKEGTKKILLRMEEGCW